MSTLAPPQVATEAQSAQPAPLRQQNRRKLPATVQRSPTHPSPTAWCLLALTAICSLLWSQAKLLSQDEIFVLQTDSVPSLHQLMDVQRHSPISLDPLAYHLAGHASLRLLHARTPAAQAFALRLPSLLGFLAMQVCLYLFVRRSGFHAHNDSSRTRERAAVLALILPALSASLFYSAEARPYGVLLGLCGVILVSWQAALQPTANRARSLVALAFSLAVALNTHYFAVLLLLPLAAAEAHRLIHRRQFDWPMLAAIVSGTAGFALTLPFQQAAAEFRGHYYNADAVSAHVISQAYRALAVDYTAFSFATQHRLAIGLLIVACAFGCMLIARLRNGRLRAQGPEATFLLALAALPLAGFLLGRFATHSFEARYVLCALVGLCALLALAGEKALSDRTAFRFLLAAGIVLMLATTLRHVASENAKAADYRASLNLPLHVRQAEAALADQHIYVQNVGQFEPALLYASADVRRKLVLSHSRAEELRWDRHDTVSLTAMHLGHFAGVPTVSWPELQGSPGPHLLILYHSGWDWTDQALAASGAQIILLGPAMGGDAVLVR